MKGTNSKNNGSFYYLNYRHSFRTENMLKSHENVWKNNYFWEFALSYQKDNILKFNQYIKSDKTLCIIFADLESLIKKIDGCANNPQKSLMTKIGAFIPCGYLTSTIWVFDNIKVSIVYTVENSV